MPISLGAVAYVLLLSVQSFANIRYLLPLFPMIPLILAECAHQMEWRKDGEAKLREQLYVVAGALGVTAMVLWCWTALPINLETVGVALTNLWNVPQGYVWGQVPVFFLIVTGVGLSVLFGVQHGLRTKSVWAGGVLVVPTVVTMAFIASCLLDFRVRFPKGAPEKDAAVFLIALFILLPVVLYYWGAKVKGWVLVGCVAASVLLGYGVIPTWHQFLKDSGTINRSDTLLMNEVQRKLPPTSIIIGERAGSLFRGTPFRTGFLSPHWEGEEFANRIVALLNETRGVPVVLIVDPVQTYQIKYLVENNHDRMTFQEVGKIPQPMVHNGQRGELVLVKLEIR